MNVTNSEIRRNEILGAVIEAYVAAASPVGSALVARKLREALSPATIRHIMVELETIGYLEQPHTSAGRVPTAQGYRWYVDRIMEVPRLSSEQVRALGAPLAHGEGDSAQVLARAGQALADLSQEAAFVVAPTVKQSRVRHIELVPVGVHKMLCVVVAEGDVVASHVIEVEEPLDRDEASAVARAASAELAGLPVAELLGALEQRLLGEQDVLGEAMKQALAILQNVLAGEPAGRLLVEGARYVVGQPEFQRQPQRAEALLEGLDAEGPLLERLHADLGTGAVRVRIGQEIGVPGLEACSYIVAPFAVGRGVVGGVGVLGPTRMDYRRHSALVQAMARAVTELLTDGEG